MKAKFIVTSIFILIGAGCVPIEYQESGLTEGHSGEAATVYDTVERHSEKKGYFYYLESVNGIPLKNAAQRTHRVTIDFAESQRLWLVSSSRQVPAGEVEMRLAAAEDSLVPLFSISSPPHESPRVSEKVTFQAKAGERYRVRGRQSSQGAAVWVETVDGDVVSDIAGDARFFQQKEHVDGTYPPRFKKLFSLSGGETGELVKSRFGKPDKVYENAQIKRETGLKRTVFVYEDLGRIKFNTYDGQMYLDHIVPPDDLEDPAILFGFLIRAPNVTKRSLIRKIYREKPPMDTDLLDRMARYVWYHRHVDDMSTQDALSWICKELSRRGEGRYNDFLTRLDLSTSSQKLKRHANASITEYVREGVSQFSLE